MLTTLGAVYEHSNTVTATWKWNTQTNQCKMSILVSSH